MHALHEHWMWVAVAATGAVGLWGLGLAVLRRPSGSRFVAAAAIATAVMLIQVSLGLLLYADSGRRDAVESAHVFYGMVVVFTFAFAYLFRQQVRRRPALVTGVLLLFVMLLGLRAWAVAG
jgi:hypothetical protein